MLFYDNNSMLLIELLNIPKIGGHVQIKFLIISLLIFVGCASRGIDNKQFMSHDKEVQLYYPQEINKLNFEKIGHIEATSCQKLLWNQHSSSEDAINQLKVISLNRGGNGVILFECANEGTTLDRNCWNAVTCQGMSIKTIEGAQKTENKISTSSGSGFFISKDGYLLTNNHVIKDAKNISIMLDQKKVSAILIDADTVNDIALLKVDVVSKAIPLDTQSEAKKGAEIVALGYPNVDIQGKSLKATFGNINDNRGITGDIRHYQISTAIQAGNSSWQFRKPIDRFKRFCYRYCCFNS